MNRFMLIMCLIAAALLTVPAYAQKIEPASYSYTVLTNGQISCSVFLPDKNDGFYRSTRWEWSGIIWQLTYDGHTYFAERKTCTPHNPLDNEHGMSTAEEFGILGAIRYDEAKPGETFMKIGVGLEEKPAGNPDYRFNGNYTLVEPGTWSTDFGETWIEFKHTLHDKYGYGYTYRKRMELLPGKPVLLISNSIENTGTRRITTDQYNHNFFAIDDTPIGPDYSVEFAFPTTISSDFGPTAGIRDNALRFFKDFDGALFTHVMGFGESPDDNHVIIRNLKTGAGVDIKGDYPIYRLNFWTDGQVLSPEMFINVDIAPGETLSWSKTYTFLAE